MLISRNLMVAFLSLVFLGGCAAGNRYDYSPSIALPIRGGGDLGLAVVDNRQYVLSGKKTPDFVGLQRGGFGNPFNVTTKSGQALADDMTESLKNALGTVGFDVRNVYFSSPDGAVIAEAIRESRLPRTVVLRVDEWKTDAMMNLRLVYDLTLTVFDSKGESIASAQDKGDETLSGSGFQSGNSANAASAFERKVGRIFNDGAIKMALTP